MIKHINRKLDFKKIRCDVVDWCDLVQDRDKRRAGISEHGNETSGSINCREFLDSINICKLLKKNSAPRNMQASK